MVRVRPDTYASFSGDGLSDKDRDTWIVKCPKCGRVSDACEHVSREDLDRVVRLLKAGVEVYESEEDLEDEEGPPQPDRVALYQLLDPRFTMEDVVLGDGTRQAIADAILEIRNKNLMFRRWGLEKVVRKKKGLSLLFAGPPGTGKTMTAEAIAKEVGRPLMIVNYAQLENMWVGETEKNIESVFKAAQEKEAVLFFDEADAVFHRRGATSAPWTNRDVNVLLHHLENHTGIVVLATNMARVLDRALDRRIDIAVEFDIPTADMRRQIFERTVPKEAPVHKDVDFAVLAKKYSLSGGSILNVVRQAMRNALRRGKRHRITMDDFMKAAESELRKSEIRRRDHTGEWKVEPRQRLGGYG
jgi:SpoVK/Ycf46/Vps4 family AAA+-type ATPase